MSEQTIETAWQAIRAQLETQRRALYDEIRHYPTPIAACDQQFNYLLEERGRIIQELRRLDEAIAASQARPDSAAPMAVVLHLEDSPALENPPNAF